MSVDRTPPEPPKEPIEPPGNRGNSPAISGLKRQSNIEIYRITMEFLAKLLLPGVVVFLVLTFGPTIDTLLRTTEEAEFAGAKLKFRQIEEAVRRGDTEEADKAFAKFRSDISGDVIRQFWKPNATEVDKANEAIIREWMQSNNIQVSITFFMRAEKYAKEREKAIRDLGLQE